MGLVGRHGFRGPGHRRAIQILDVRRAHHQPVDLTKGILQSHSQIAVAGIWQLHHSNLAPVLWGCHDPDSVAHPQPALALHARPLRRRHRRRLLRGLHQLQIRWPYLQHVRAVQELHPQNPSPGIRRFHAAQPAVVARAGGQVRDPDGVTNLQPSQRILWHRCLLHLRRWLRGQVFHCGHQLKEGAVEGHPGDVLVGDLVANHHHSAWVHTLHRVNFALVGGVCRLAAQLHLVALPELAPWSWKWHIWRCSSILRGPGMHHRHGRRNHGGHALHGPHEVVRHRLLVGRHTGHAHGHAHGRHTGHAHGRHPVGRCEAGDRPLRCQHGHLGHF
mmetsp:Transcript_55620/g.133071  ORF Transcript_55620/g.133071 Transcript_55620/m.133071 type:complete len:331 (+) Transcript_55620:429-1421(+)